MIGARGGVGATTTAITIAGMLGTRLKEEVLLIDHLGAERVPVDDA